MKLCPECDFIYEDNQSFCDMDGKELVHRPAPEPPRSRLTIPVPPPGQPAGRRSSGMAVAAVVVFILAALVVGVYVARTRPTRARRAVPVPQSSQAGDQPPQSRVQPPDLAQQQADSAADQNAANHQTSPSVANPSSELTPDSSRTALAHSRLTASPVSASAATPNGHGLVLVRLTNGATIRADEAWEKREGVWYRQAGMVTFLKRSRVRSIERVASQPLQPSLAAGAGSGSTGAANGGRSSNSASNQNSRNTHARDQLRIAKLEPVNQKKPSRVASFLKKTGNLIKKPFKF